MNSAWSRLSSVLLRRRARYAVTTAAVVLLTLGGAQVSLQAQVLYGSLVGNVVDESGAALPGAAVTVTHKETGATREAVADTAGGYRFPNLQSGTYTLTVKVDGFRTFTRSDLPVTLNNVTRADAALQVGQLSESVTVSGERPLLQTDRAEVRSELKAQELVNLPVSINRNYQYLLRVVPGFTPPAEAHSVPSNPSRALVFNVNGASRSSNNIRIDGVSTTNLWLPHVAAYVPALESLETVNVVTSSFDAEQGLAGGSAINVQIKSGTNNVHGAGFEFFSDERFRTNNYFSKLNGTPKGDWRYNQFGGTLGGPVRAQQALLLRQLRGDPRSPGADPHAVGADRGAAQRRSQRVYAADLRPADRRGQRVGPHRVCRQPDSPGADRQDRAHAARGAAVAESQKSRRHDPRDQQLLRGRAVHPEPPYPRHQGELERDQQIELLRPVQRARLRHRERDQLRRPAAGTAAREQQPGPRRRQHLQLLGGQHLHAVVDARDGRARRLRAHEQQRRADRSGGEQGARLARIARHQRRQVL